jgi:hypothetical protein
MKTSAHHLRHSLALPAVAALLAACAPDAPLAPPQVPAAPQFSKDRGDAAAVIATIQRATARYHNLDAAIADGFVFLHGCETRPDEGPAGMVYVHFGRLLDGIADPASPEALLYEPRTTGRPKLVGVELAIPYALWTQQQPPELLGAEYQREDEFGVYGLHVWVWRANPEGLFAESNPRVSCDGE